jgi:hypothetical protein
MVDNYGCEIDKLAGQSLNLPVYCLPASINHLFASVMRPTWRTPMLRTKLDIDQSHRANLCLPLCSVAQQPGQKTFSSPEEASAALVTAVQSNDEKAMLDVLGSDAKTLVSSGDEAEDASSRANFVQRYRKMHRLVKEPDGTTTLYIGAKNWPTPIPLVHTANSWYFDTDAAKKEIVYRRIGRNELSTIRVCQELVAAEKEYRDARHGEYADKIYSDEGQRNGLYWKAAAGEPKSPIGPLVASAVAQSSAGGSERALTPYRGYYFHVLTLQGKGAPGGAKGNALAIQCHNFPIEKKSAGREGRNDRRDPRKSVRPIDSVPG